MLLLGTSLVPPIEGVSLGHHDLSHHGKDPVKIAQLRILEVEKLKILRNFLTQLKQTREEGDNLLDRTMVFFSSNLADASKHSVKNMPVLLAGGGFKHGQHLAFDENKNPPLSNLFVSMLQRMNIEADKFGSSIAQALRVQSDSMRTRRRQLAEEKAAKTAVKLIFPLVIFIFPAIFVVLVGPAAITIVNEMFPMMNPGGK